MLKGKYLARVLGVLLIGGAMAGGTASAASAATLSGAGSTLIAPLEAEWASAYEASNSGTTITYQSVGSGQGLLDIAGGQVDFGASDAPLSASSTTCHNCVQMPWALTGVGIGFHINGVRSIRLTGNVIAQIYVGIIKKWNDPRIQNLQKRGVHLPNLQITPFFRSDGSGDTYAFTDYESVVSRTFKNRIGSATTVSWPTGVGAKGNSGMVQSLAATNGGIAYITTAYLIADWPYAAAVKNQAGNWEVPNFNNIKNAAQAFTSLGPNNEIHIVNPPKSARIAYPISTYTYVIVPQTAPQASLLKSFIGFAINGGQALGPRLDFVPIPPFIRSADQNTLNSVHS